jgi:hypothetical protein
MSGKCSKQACLKKFKNYLNITFTVLNLHVCFRLSGTDLIDCASCQDSNNSYFDSKVVINTRY